MVDDNSTTRLNLGLTAGGAASLDFRDRNGRSRLRSVVTPDGQGGLFHQFRESSQHDLVQFGAVPRRAETDSRDSRRLRGPVARVAPLPARESIPPEQAAPDPATRDKPSIHTRTHPPRRFERLGGLARSSGGARWSGK